jgi:ribonucleoside-diphosphate reductase alpha subunit
MYVIKRNGDKQTVKFDKITTRIEKLIIGNDIYKTIRGVDPVIITQKICNRIYSKITTSELDNLASQICMSMITDHPDFGELASRIVVSNHHKNTVSNMFDVVNLLYNNKDETGEMAPLVNKEFFKVVSKYESEIASMIDFDRDYLLDFFGFKTLERSYLLRINNKDKKVIVERPQHLFMRVAIGIHGYDLENIKKTYDSLSLKKYTHATPTLFNAGTTRQQLASCFLSSIEDSIEGIFDTYKDCGLISKWAGGIGVHLSNIRCKDSYIRKTGGKSDGLVPLLRTFNDIARQFNQGGKRLGSFAMYLEVHHADIFEFLEAKKNHGSEQERARDLFYALWVCDLFMERVEMDGDWYLMNPDICRGLNEVYGEDYNNLYNKYVCEGKYKKKIKARDLWKAIIGSQVEVGVPYICYKDHVNKKSNQKNIGVIKSSNLCSEIMEYSDKDEIAVCNLASICLPSVLDKPYNSYLDGSEYVDDIEREFLVNLYEGELLLYSKDDCLYCKLLKNVLDNDEGVKSYKIIDKEEVEKLLPEIIFETVPQLLSIRNKEVIILGDYETCWKVLKPRINYAKLSDIAYDLTYNLNNVIDVNYYPVEKTKVSNMKHRPIGIGIQGLADVFFMLKIGYESQEARDINKKIFETIYYGAMSCSNDLAKESEPYSTFTGSPLSEGKFQFDLWDLKDSDLSGLWDWQPLREKVMKFGVRNSLLIALMPTASTSQIMGYTESFESITSNIYTRKTLAGEFTVINKYLIEDLITLDIWNEDTKDRIIYDRGSVQNVRKLPNFLKEVYKTVWEIPQKNIVEMSADRAPFICQSQSLNLSFEKPTFIELTNVHFLGWKKGLKTGMYYCRSKAASNAQRFGMDITKEKKLKDEDQEEGCLTCSA